MIPRPLGLRVLVKTLDPEKTASRIWTPPTMETDTRRGAVVEIGDEVRYLEQGDEILFASAGVIQFEHEGETYFVMPEGQALVLLDRLSEHAVS